MEKIQIGLPGQVGMQKSYEDSERFWIPYGVGGYEAGFISRQTGRAWVAEVFEIDGYDYEARTKEWPVDRDAVHYDSKVREHFEVPDGFMFAVSGMNDTREGGYILYTSGFFVPADTEEGRKFNDIWWNSVDIDQ